MARAWKTYPSDEIFPITFVLRYKLSQKEIRVLGQYTRNVSRVNGSTFNIEFKNYDELARSNIVRNSWLNGTCDRDNPVCLDRKSLKLRPRLVKISLARVRGNGDFSKVHANLSQKQEEEKKKEILSRHVRKHVV